jgi:hypothetical protein
VCDNDPLGVYLSKGMIPQKLYALKKAKTILEAV